MTKSARRQGMSDHDRSKTSTELNPAVGEGAKAFRWLISLSVPLLLGACAPSDVVMPPRAATRLVSSCPPRPVVRVVFDTSSAAILLRARACDSDVPLAIEFVEIADGPKVICAAITVRTNPHGVMEWNVSQACPDLKPHMRYHLLVNTLDGAQGTAEFSWLGPGGPVQIHAQECKQAASM